MSENNALYRGVVLNSEQFLNYDFNKDLVPPNPPKIDKFGRKTVGDGNEYGVYMTTNLDMARGAYGNPKGSGSKTISLTSTNIGVIYEINSEGLDIREPWLDPLFKDIDGQKTHYNNGFEGKEYIADVIPISNVRLKEVVIAADFLHERETIGNIANIEDLKDKVREILAKRFKECELVEACLGKGKEIPDWIKRLFQTGEVYNMDVSKIDASTDRGAITYLLAINSRYGVENTRLTKDDIKKIAQAPKKGLVEIRKYDFNHSEKSAYLALYESHALLLENTTPVDSQGKSFVRANEKMLESKMKSIVRKMLEEKLTEGVIRAFISDYKASPEFNGEKGKIFEELSINYKIQKIILSLSDKERKVLLNIAIADMNKLQIFCENGDINMQMQLPDGNVVYGEYQTLFGKRDLEQHKESLPKSMQKTTLEASKPAISPSVLAMRSHIYMLEDAGYSENEIDKFIQQNDWETMNPVKVVETIMMAAKIPENQRRLNEGNRSRNIENIDGRRNRRCEGWVR